MKTTNEPVVECPACVAKRLHTEEEWREFHPKAGSGFDARLTG